ncbi:BLUF domain-containing protein [Paracoccus suum]|nr:BLUF domain-containing protein [Paracoccus suum]
MNTQAGTLRASTAGQLVSVLYRSHALLSRDAFEASGAPAQFAANNRLRGITGYLHIEDGMFYQHLEGEAGAIGPLWNAIAADPRHRDVTEIGGGAIATRRFDRWAMGYNASDHRSLFDWTARSGLSLKGRHYAQVLTAFLEYASAGARVPA